MAYEVILPKLGQTVEEGRIVEWLKKEGDRVQQGDVLFTVETDKAVLDVEATRRGYLRKILVPAGETRPVLTVVALMTRTPDEPLEEDTMPSVAPGTMAEAAEAVERVEPSEAPAPPTESPAPGAARERIFASPRARKLAREHGVALEEITGTGPNGRIVERDVQAYLDSMPKVTPVARQLAEHLGVDLRQVTGTGPQGRITKADVEAAAAVVAAAEAGPTPEVQEPQPRGAQEPSAAPEAEAVPLSGLRAIIAERMRESHLTTAHFTLTMEVDATALVELRERLKQRLADILGFNLSYNDLMIKLVAQALRAFPYMNVRQSGDAIQEMKGIHIGLAVDTERGLLVPHVFDADKKGLVEIARDVRAMVERARKGKSLPDELTLGTFTITNLGMYEVDAFSPIINYPETAILGVGRIKPVPAVVDGEVVVRQRMWLSLTVDHRVVDGAPAARFLQHVKELIEDPLLLLA